MKNKDALLMKFKEVYGDNTDVRVFLRQEE